jgi:hypothetical protein
MLEQPGFWIAIVGATASLVGLFVVVRKIERNRREVKINQVTAIEHPVLGTLTYDAGVEAWRCSYEPGSFGFLIAGVSEPDARLVDHAVDLKENAAEFLAVVKSFLVGEASQQPQWSDEIRRLTLQEVCLFWPARPNDGMLYFATENETGRVWRADYVDRTPVGLGFDS